MDYWTRLAKDRNMGELCAESTAADRAREYRRGLEDAAKVCERLAREWSHDTNPHDDRSYGDAGREMAVAIRALIDASPER